MKTVIEMAREAGFKMGTAWYANTKVLDRFAAIVREDCAKSLENHCETNHGLMSDEGYSMAVRHCAEAIRARGE